MTEQFRYTDEQFADIQMLRYRLDGFEALTLRQKLYIYYLAKATLCGRDITTDQFGRYNLRIRKVLEAIYERYEVRPHDRRVQSIGDISQASVVLERHTPPLRLREVCTSFY